ncbi:hypothetical protein G7047_19395 [Diaphorobacter sp. HDW4A]|uniref:hypothetical protein n=1 Tax=Diaphorobacter sp. HDW4A TaxID=2714924 RepID=UPI00140C5AAF|nr:hypothetical protein [Diaphorobacter sp. HDW4A]QIL81841.1 hypothetical protein G7047_19395 [Diaphorobacter sp. HDW4A]
MSANKRYEPWTPEQIKTLRRLYATHSAAQLATLIGRSESSVKNRVEALGLAKRKEVHRPWTAAEDVMLTRIYDPRKIDQVAAMMNRSRSAITHRATFLNIPGRAVTLSVGAMRTDSQGIVQVKVSDKKKNGFRNYKRLCVLEWEAVNGPLPKGMCLVPRNPFLPRTPDNMVMVPEAERFSHHNMASASPEVQELLRIQRQINREFREVSKRTERSPT